MTAGPGDDEIACGEDAAASEPAASAGEQQRQDAGAGGIACSSDRVIADVPESAEGTTAFFVFSHVNRAWVRDELLRQGGDSKLGHVAKAIGVLWRACSDDVKKRYADKALQVRRCVSK